MPALTTGQKLGAYVVDVLLGQGGMAEVYRGQHTGLDRRVAIKVLNPALGDDPTFPLRFQREARTVARLKHPNIVTVYDFGEQGDLAYLVMELASGTLSDHTADVQTLGELVDELTPIAEALQFAHTQGVIHRDLKPDNVLRAEQRSVLADFGLARIRSETLDADEVGMIVGTPHYMAPEQALGEDVDHRADIYAFAIMVYQLISGVLPYRGDTFFAIVQQQLKAPVPSLRAVAADAPVRLDEVLKRALAKSPRERFESMSAFMTELRRAAAEAPGLPVGEARAKLGFAGTGVLPGAVGEPPPAPTLSEVLFCSACGNVYRDSDHFCRQCGAPRSTAARAADPVARTVALPGAAAPVPAVAARMNGDERSALRDLAGDLPRPVLHPRRGLRRKVTSFTPAQWALIAVVTVIALVINGIGLWLIKSGRGAGADAAGAALTTYIYDHLRAFKSGMAAFALVSAITATVTMRTAVLSTRQLAPAAYQRLRRLHRLSGYAATAVAVAIGLLTCLIAFGFGTGSWRSVAHSLVGSVVLVVLAIKIAIVRWFPAQRRYLSILGHSLLVMFVLVFLSSSVPYLVEVLRGESGGYSDYPSGPGYRP